MVNEAQLTRAIKAKMARAVSHLDAARVAAHEEPATEQSIFLTQQRIKLASRELASANRVAASLAGFRARPEVAS